MIKLTRRDRDIERWRTFGARLAPFEGGTGCLVALACRPAAQVQPGLFSVRRN